MAQQAKDIYSGIKKIFPSSRRSSGSFSFTGRSSSSASAPPAAADGGDELSAAALAAAHEADGKGRGRKKERRPSFSLWGKDKHRASASGSGSVSGPGPAAGHGEKEVVMSLPYGAQAATPKGYAMAKELPDQNQDPNQPRGSLYNEPSAAVTSASSRASRSSLSAGPLHSQAHAHGFSSGSELSQPPKLGARSVSVDLTGRSARHSGRAPDFSTPPLAAQPPAGSRAARASDRVLSTSSGLLHYGAAPSSGSGARVGRRARHNSATNISLAPTSSSGSSVRSFSSSVSELTAPTVLENEPLPAPPRRKDSLAVYRHTLQQSAATNASGSRPTGAGRSSLSSLSLSSAGGAPSSSVLTPEKPKKKKERRTSLSFSSHRKKQEPEMPVVNDFAAPVVKPHANTWDSDSDDDYEDTKRPTRGLDRRSQSMDFMEQAPTHLISKIWRKLPIQARLIGGRGSIDLDLQKDRNSFSRSSNAKQLREKDGKASSPSRRPPSPVPDESNVFGDKGIRFNYKVHYADPSIGQAGIESYDDVLVRVCRFASHDKRRTATKVQEFLERSMAFLHGTRTRHGNVVSISNEEIRMWRRLALHDWALEELTAAPSTTTDKKDERSSSSVSTADSEDSGDEPVSKLHTMSESVDEEREEDPDDEDLTLPEQLSLAKLREAINYCVGFGERVFTTDEISDLVHLEFLVEEDGWI